MLERAYRGFSVSRVNRDVRIKVHGELREIFLLAFHIANAFSSPYVGIYHILSGICKKLCYTSLSDGNISYIINMD